MKILHWCNRCKYFTMCCNILSQFQAKNQLLTEHW